jgi:hypothetical protein
MTGTEVLVELDERRRVSLGKVGRPEHRRYLAHEEAGGVIVLVPVRVVTEADAERLGIGEQIDQIERGVKDPTTRTRRGRRPTRHDE